MCLYSKTRIPVKTENPLKCWKTVLRYDLPGGTFRKTSVMKRDIPDVSEPLSADGRFNVSEIVSENKETLFSVSGGAVHSYADADDCKGELTRLLFTEVLQARAGRYTYRSFSAEMWECEIPGGTSYYKGPMNSDGSGPVTYASEKINFIRKIAEV